MNKILVGVISSLATLGIVGGAGAIALSSPDVKENLSVSFGQNDLLGNNVTSNNNKIKELSGQLSDTKILLAVEQNKVLDLTNQVDKLNEDKTQCKVQIAILKGDNADLTSEVNTLNNKITTANNKITTLENQVSNYQTQITNLRNTNTKLNNNIQTLRSENTQLESDLSIATSELEMMNSELEMLKLDNDNNILQIQELENSIMDKENEIIGLQDSISQNEMTISDLEMEISNKNAQIEVLENEQSNANVEITNLNNEIAILNTEISDLNNTISTNNETIMELNNTISTKNDEIVTLESQLEESHNTINSLNAQVETLSSEITALNQQVSSYESLLENYAVVDYVVDGTSNLIIQDKNSNISFDNPKKYGYKFTGWSLTNDGDLLSADYMIAGDMTLYAVFEQKYGFSDLSYYGKLDETHYICSKYDGIAGVFIYDVENWYSEQLYSQGYYWCNCHVFASGDALISSDKYGVDGLLYYSKEKNTITKIYNYRYQWKTCVDIGNGKYLITGGMGSGGSTNIIFDDNTKTISQVTGGGFCEKFIKLQDGNLLGLGGSATYFDIENLTATQVFTPSVSASYVQTKELPNGDVLFGSYSADTGCHLFNLETKQCTTILETGGAYCEYTILNNNLCLINSRDDNFLYEYDYVNRQLLENQYEFVNGTTSNYRSFALKNGDALLFERKGIYLYDATAKSLGLIFEDSINGYSGVFELANGDVFISVGTIVGNSVHGNLMHYSVETKTITKCLDDGKYKNGDAFAVSMINENDYLVSTSVGMYQFHLDSFTFTSSAGISYLNIHVDVGNGKFLCSSTSSSYSGLYLIDTTANTSKKIYNAGKQWEDIIDVGDGYFLITGDYNNSGNIPYGVLLYNSNEESITLLFDKLNRIRKGTIIDENRFHLNQMGAFVGYTLIYDNTTKTIEVVGYVPTT